MANSAVTPGRRTHITFDVAENTLAESPFALLRDAHQIAQGHQGQANSNHWHFLEPNAIVCEPWSDDPSNLHQKTDTPGAIIRLSDFDSVTGMVERNTWRKPTDLTGVTVDTSVAATGDPFIQKTVGAGITWNQSKSADQAAFGQVQPTGTNVSWDRVAVGKTVHPANQGYVVRFVLPAYAPHHKECVGIFYFGGPISAQVNGLIPTGTFGLQFTGHGTLNLWMRVKTGSAFEMVRIDYWYAYTMSSSTQVITCRIWPYYTPEGVPAIQFKTDVGGATPASGSLFSPYFANRSNPQVHTWYGWGRNGPTVDPSPLPVTGPGPVRIDHPRDLRPSFQVSRIKHVTDATVQDDIFAPDFFPTTVAPFTFTWQDYTSGDASIEAALFDASDDTELEVVDSGDHYKIYNLNAGHYHYYAKFILHPSSDGNSSPVLYSYKVDRDGVYRENAPGAVTLPGTAVLAALRQVSVTGPDKDLTHETASLVIEDVGAELTVLNTRARIRTRVETEYNPLNTALRSVLFDGYVDRADGKQKGTKGNYGVGQAGSARLFPSPNWKEFEMTLSGMWRRLNQQLTYQRVYLLNLKITDVCRSMLAWAGFPPGQIDVPDDPTIFLPSTGGSDENLLQPFATVGDTVAGFLHDYLGWFLVWDGNAGASGMMRAIVPPPLQGPYNPLARFTLDLPASGRLSHLPGSYGSTGWYATGSGDSVVIPTMFIRKRTYQTHVKPPECNAIHVTGTGLTLPNRAGQYQLNQWLFNPRSYNFFVDGGGSLVETADPSDPDYLGEIIPLVVVNTNLSTQHACDIYARRLYDVSAHALKWVMFEAPLALVIDGTDSNQTNLRPLKYYDAVYLRSGGVDFTFLVRSANPSYVKDGLQMMHVELSSIPA